LTKYSCEIICHERCKGVLTHRDDSELSKRIEKTLSDIRGNAFIGSYIKRTLWPPPYKGLDNLYVIKLGKRHRLLYSVIIEKCKRFATIHDFLSHSEYDRLFGYHT